MLACSLNCVNGSSESFLYGVLAYSLIVSGYNASNALHNVRGGVTHIHFLAV